MNKAALFITALAMTITIQAQNPPAPKTTPTSDRLRQMIAAGATTPPRPPSGLTLVSVTPTPPTAGLPAPSAGVSQPTGPAAASTPQPTATVPPPIQPVSAQNIPPLTPAEIQILRSWIQQGGISASAPTITRPATAATQ